MGDASSGLERVVQSERQHLEALARARSAAEARVAEAEAAEARARSAPEAALGADLEALKRRLADQVDTRKAAITAHYEEEAARYDGVSEAEVLRLAELVVARVLELS